MEFEELKQVRSREGLGWGGGVLPVMKYIKGQRNLSFWSVKRPKRLTDAFFGCGKVKKTF